MKPVPFILTLFVFSSTKMDGVSNHARFEFSAKPNAANTAPSTYLFARGNGLTYPNLGNIGNPSLHYTRLNFAANLG